MKKYFFFSLIIFTCLSDLVIADKPNRPNIVWLIAEDSSKHYFKLYDPQGATTPTLDKLAEQGLTFNHAFSNAPVCSTARSTLALGAYGPRLGTAYHRAYQKPVLPKGLVPASKLLMDAGYYTSNNSKTDYNFAKAPSSLWNDSSQGATWRNRKKDQPFFHIQTWNYSHEQKVHFPLEDVKKKRTHHDPKKIQLPPIYPNTELFRYTYARYLDSIQNVDKKLGEVVSSLQKDGLLEDTFIFYFGDHGGVLPGSKGYLYERGLHIPLVVRIPDNYKHLLPKDVAGMIGKKIDGFVNFIDFAPTILHLAGVKKNEQMDGQPFLGKGVDLKNLSLRNASFSYADRFDEKYDMVRSLRIGKFKYIRNYEPFNPNGLFNHYRYKQHAYQQWRSLFRQGKLNSVQSEFFLEKPVEALFNVEADPFETQNLATLKEYQDVLLSLRKKLSDQVKSLPDLNFYPESELIRSAFSDTEKFASQNKTQLAKLVDIADLQLQDYPKTRSLLFKTLESTKVWERYWSLITLTRFHNEVGNKGVRAVKAFLDKEKNNLNRARAAQLLALASGYNPVQVILESIGQSSDVIEILEIMNIAAQLYDTKGYVFKVPLREEWRKPKDKRNRAQKHTNILMENRILYIGGNAQQL